MVVEPENQEEQPKPPTEEPEPKEEAEPEAKEEGQEDAEGEPKEEKPEGEEPEGEKAEEDAEAKKAGEPEPEEKRKRAGGWQRKIDRLERMNEQLVQQLGSQRPAPTNAKPPKEQTAEEKAAADAAAYMDGLVDQRLALREAKQRQQAVVADFQRRTAEVRAKIPDFEDVVMSADIPGESALGQVLLTSEHGPAIMYQLAKNPGELARISALPPLDAAREVGRLEAKLASVAPAPAKPKSANRPPVPPTSVNGSASSARNLDDLPLSEYKRAYRSGRR